MEKNEVRVPIIEETEGARRATGNKSVPILFGMIFVKNSQYCYLLILRYKLRDYYHAAINGWPMAET